MSNNPSIKSTSQIYATRNGRNSNIEEDTTDIQSVDQVENFSESLQNVWHSAIGDALHDLDCDRNDVSVIPEENAFLSFFEKFDSKYGNSHINFQYCSLRQAIINCHARSKYDDKLLALYLHNENDPFSQNICPEFINGDIRNILETFFEVLACDLLSNTNSALELAIDEWPNLEIIKKWIGSKQSALFILLARNDTVTIVTKWDSGALYHDILHGLQQIEKSFCSSGIEEEKKGPREFHQQVCDLFCERDYISFEASEHSLLKNNIGYSKFGAPVGEEYTEKQNIMIEKTYQVIISQSNKCAEWKDHVTISIIFNCLIPISSKDQTDILSYPVYIIRKCFGSSNPCRIFIDHDDRVYNSWKDYLKDNKLPKGLMVVPTDGRYCNDANYQVNLTACASPACSVPNAVLKGTDIASSVIGTSSGGLVLLAAIPSIAIAPVAITVAGISAVGAGIYAIVRSSIDIHDKRIHHESLSIQNAEARSAYLHILGGVLSFTGMGATATVSKLAEKGFQIGTGVKVALNVVNAANIGSNAIGIANSSYGMYSTWKEHKKLSTLAVIQLSSSVLFFTHAVCTFKTANTIIDEAQSMEITKITNALSSNRKKKMFNKLLKKTINANNGDQQIARAEVIRSTSKLQNKEEVFKFFASNDKKFEKKGIKFVAKNGKINLYGTDIDISDLLTMSSSDREKIYNNVPTDYEPCLQQIQKTDNNVCTVIIKMITHPVVVQIAKSVAEVWSKSEKDEDTTVKCVSIILDGITPIIQHKLLQVFEIALDSLKVHEVMLANIYSEYADKIHPFLIILSYFLEFFQKQLGENEKTCSSQFGEVAKPLLYKLQVILDLILQRGNVSKYILQNLTNYIVRMFLKKFLTEVERRAIRKKRIQNAKANAPCKICGGQFFIC